mgnify:CR=1 FL=1
MSEMWECDLGELEGCRSLEANSKGQRGLVWIGFGGSGSI